MTYIFAVLICMSNGCFPPTNRPPMTFQSAEECRQWANPINQTNFKNNPNYDVTYKCFKKLVAGWQPIND